jgi:hypothetical protein
MHAASEPKHVKHFRACAAYVGASRERVLAAKYLVEYI